MNLFVVGQNILTGATGILWIGRGLGGRYKVTFTEVVTCVPGPSQLAGLKEAASGLNAGPLSGLCKRG